MTQSLQRLTGLLLAALIPTVGHAGDTAVAAAPTSPAGMLQVMIGLILVLGVLVVIAWGVKKIGGGKPVGSRAIHIVGGINVGNRERILVVEVANEWIVVGVTATSITALSTMPKQEGVTLLPATPIAKNFSAWLQQTIDKRNGTLTKSPSDSDHAS